MPRTRHLEKDLLLPFEKDLPVIDAPGGIHHPVGLYKLLAGEASVELIFLRAVGRNGQLGVGFCCCHPGSVIWFRFPPALSRFQPNLLDCKWKPEVAKARKVIESKYFGQTT